VAPRQNERERDREAERYRRAAIDAVGQLDWCIQYLYRLHKTGIAETLSRNRSTIVNKARLFG
jgi:hypothetical protein